MKREISKAIKGTWILTIASLFSEFLSAVYRIPLQNIVGDRGYFIYQQVYPIYGIFTVLALSGLPVVISKMFAQQDSIASKGKLLKRTFFILLITCSVITIMLWGTARYLAFFMGDPGLYKEIRAVALTFLLIPFEASLRGYFQSDLMMTPSAISQILEQLVRIIVIIAAAIMFGSGLLNVYQMGTLANLGAFIGGLFAVLVLVSTFSFRGQKLKTKELNPQLKIENGLALEIILIVIFTGITIFYQFIDSFTMLRLLMWNNRPLPEAEILKGIFDRAQPLIQLGIVVSLSFVSTIMPQLKEKDKSQPNRSLIQKMMKVCLWLAIAETAGLIALMPEINTMLFTNSDGSVALGIYMLSIVIVSFVNLMIAITSSDNERNLRKLILFIISLVLKVALNIVLIPYLNIIGAALATVLSECVILFGLLIIYMGEHEFMLDKLFVGKLLLSGVIMTLLIRFLEKVLTHYLVLNRINSIIINLILIPIGIVIYLWLSKLWKVLQKDEWEIIPLGKYLTKIMRIKD